MIKDLILASSAEKKIVNLLKNQKKDNLFRIEVKGGGCSGFKYIFKIDKPVPEDIVINQIIIDRNSLELIKGSTLDYKKELIGDSFVIKNPKAKSSCGCGLSFSV